MCFAPETTYLRLTEVEQTAYAIKWAIVSLMFVFFLVFFVGGYFHAQRRIKKGLPPLRYHRWFLPRRQRMIYMNGGNGSVPQNQFSFYNQAYPMQPGRDMYGAPPPGKRTKYESTGPRG